MAQSQPNTETPQKPKTQSLYISAEESRLWKELAAHFCIMQASGSEAYQAGDKNVLASLIAISGRLCPEPTARLLQALINDIPHQPKSNGRGSYIVLTGVKDMDAWNKLAGKMELDYHHQSQAAQLARRIAAAYQRDPNQVRQQIEAILDLVPQQGDLAALYQEALTPAQIKRLLDAIKADFMPTERPSQKGWQPSPIVPHRTLAMLLTCLLTGLRGQSFLQLRFKHLQMRADGACVVATPDAAERTYVVHDRRFHGAIKGYLAIIGRNDIYRQLEAGQRPDSDELLWQSDPERSDETPTQAYPKWGFLKPLNRYAQRADIAAVSQTKLLATYAWLLSQYFRDPLDVRCNLVPVGERTTDVELHLP